MLDIDLVTPSGATGNTTLSSRLASFSDQATDTPLVGIATCFGLGSYGRATYLRIYPSSGTLTGRYRVIAERSFGE
jgi:hypothetical protein